MELNLDETDPGYADVYEQFVSEMSVVDDYPIIYPALGLGGEAGEVVDQVKKLLRNEKGELTPERCDKIIDEMGDTLFYLVMLGHHLNTDLFDVMQKNMKKLYDRKKRGSGTKHGLFHG